VAIGRALVRDPAVFLFDEPLSNLDAKLRMEMRSELRHLHEMLGTTVVYVTHDQIEAMTLATRIAIMRDGRIEQIGTPEEIYDRPANLYVAGFVGSPAMNVLAATVSRRDSELVATLEESGQTIALPAALGARLAADGKVVIGIRPEAIRLAAEGEANAVQAVVEDVELIGPEKLITARIGHAVVTARVEPHTGIRNGADCSFVFGESGISLFDPITSKRL
jgi:multiple sugar transport system ATP-binding protein